MSVVDRVYAKALFEAAQEEKKLEPVREQLAQLVEAEREVPELRELLRNPQVDPRARRAALEDVLTGSEELLRNFLLVLADKGRAGQLEEIANEFERLVAEHEGVVHAELTTAVELSDDEAQQAAAADRAGLGPQGRGDPHRRPGPDRRHRPASWFPSSRRERARPARPAPPTARHRLRGDS